MWNKSYCLLLCGSLVVASLLSACKKEDEISNEFPDPTVPPPTDSKIMLVNENYFLVADPTLQKLVTIKENTKKLAELVPCFNYNTPYLTIYPGLQSISVASAAGVVYSSNETIELGKTYSLFYSPDLSGAAASKSLFIEDDLTTPSGSNAHLRFVHLSPNAPSVDVSLYKTVISKADNANVDKDTKSSTRAGIQFTITDEVFLHSFEVKNLGVDSFNVAVNFYQDAPNYPLYKTVTKFIKKNSLNEFVVDTIFAPGTYRMVANTSNKNLAYRDSGQVYPESFSSFGFGQIDGSIDSLDASINSADTSYNFFYNFNWFVENTPDFIDNTAFNTCTPFVPVLNSTYVLAIELDNTNQPVSYIKDFKLDQSKIYTLIAKGLLNPSGVEPGLGLKIITNK